MLRYYVLFTEVNTLIVYGTQERWGIRAKTPFSNKRNHTGDHFDNQRIMNVTGGRGTQNDRAIFTPNYLVVQWERIRQEVE